MTSKTRLCPVLDYRRFEAIFGNVSESSVRKAGDEVLEWYESVGKEKLRSYSGWEDGIASRMGLKRPDLDNLDAMDDYLTAIDSWDDEKWLVAAKKTIREDLGTEIFEFAGMGSFKVCLYSKDGKALKFGRNGDSLKKEILNNRRFSGYSCVPRMFGYDEETMQSYLCEFARESVRDDFRTIYGVDGAGDFFTRVRDGIRFPKRLSPALLDGIAQMSDMISELGLIDVDGENNLGLVVRDGVRQIILIDYDL